MSKKILLIPLLALAFLAPASGVSAQSNSCTQLSYNLYFGRTDAQTGGEVSKLQAMLGGQVTGYFGPLTEQLVEAFQAKQGVVSSGSPDTTGYGAVGPRTRALLATECGATTPIGVSPLSPSPSNPEPSTGTASSLPSCKISHTRSSETFTVGDRVRINWTSTNAAGAKWVKDTSGKDFQTPPSGTPGVAGSAYLVLDVIGIAEVKLEVTGRGGTSSCSLSLAVEEKSDTEGTASIDASSLKAVPTGPTTITGRAENVNKLYVYQVSSSYTGGLDYESIVEANRGEGASGQTAIIAYPNPSEVRNGKWSAYFGGWPTVGTYTVLVFDAESKARLATGKLVVAGVDTTGSVTFSKSTHDTARPTLTGSAKNLESFTLVLTGIQDKYADVVFVRNGKWSHKISFEMLNGTYGVEAYDPKGNLLGKGTFRVVVPEEEDEEVAQEKTWRGVTAVGVYEGSYTASNPRVFQGNVEGYVNVNVTGDVGGQNNDLVLTSYEPVNWILNVQDGVKINKIIVAGYNKSRVTNVPAGTEVEYRSYATDGTFYYAYQSSGDSYTKLYNWLKGMYPGASNDLLGNFVFPGYSASSINVYVGLKG